MTENSNVHLGLFSLLINTLQTSEDFYQIFKAFRKRLYMFFKYLTAFVAFGLQEKVCICAKKIKN